MAGRFALMLALLGLLIPAWASAFDCGQAATAVERAVCADPQAKALDEQLAALYGQVLQQRPGLADALRQDQLDWLAERDDMAWQLLATADDPAGRQAAATVQPSLQSLYRRRIAWLQAARAGDVPDLPLLKDLLARRPPFPASLERLPSWWATALPGATLAAKLDRLPGEPDPALQAKLAGLGHVAGTHWLAAAGLGGSYAIEGSADCEDWVLFRAGADRLTPVPVPDTLGGPVCWDIVGQLATYQGRAYALAVGANTALPASLSVEAQAYEQGRWGAPQYLVMRYAHDLRQSWSACLGDCAGLDEEALRIARRYDRRPLPELLRQGLDADAQAALKLLSAQATAQGDTVASLVQRRPGDYASLRDYGREAGYLVLRWRGRWLLGRIGHPHVGWRSNADWQLSFWYDERGSLKPLAGYLFAPQPKTLRLAFAQSPPKRP